MNLFEAISNIDILPENATLFVERINGSFRPDSRVFVLELTDQELVQPVKDVALARAPGAEYFLEVSIAREVTEDWQRNHGGRAPDVHEAMESITYYAEHDAYPKSFFGKQ